MTETPNPKQVLAAESLATGATKAQAARNAGVNRATVTKWSQSAEFLSLVEAVKPGLAGEAVTGLHQLIPQSLQLLQGALEGSDVSVTRARIALDIIKAAAGIAQDKADAGPTDLERRLAQLDTEPDSRGD